MASLDIAHWERTKRESCPICKLASQTIAEDMSTTYQFQCERCGRYDFTGRSAGALEALSDDSRPVVSEWVYRQNRLGIVPKFLEHEVSEIANGPHISFVEKVRRLVEYVAERSPLPGTAIEVRKLLIEAMLQSYGSKVVEVICEHLRNEHLATRPTPNTIALTPKGLMHAEEWGRSIIASAQGFVAMWFDAAMDIAWHDGFEPAINGAGYVLRRIDKIEHINKICDEIVAEIRRSKFVVADFSGQRQGVYYEAGFATGLNIPVIYTCRAGEVKDLHFDVRQYNTIEWAAPEQLAGLLQTRIEAVIGEGPNKRR